MKNKIILLSILCGASCYRADAQQIGPSIINSSGGSATISGNSYEYAIGEMSIVSTATTAGNVYTQGILQPAVLKSDAIGNTVLSKQLFNVYPNPTSDKLNIQLKNNTTIISSIQLIDLLGHVVFNDATINTQSIYSLDMQAYANATYTLKINIRNNTQPFIFKITKSNQ